MIHEIEARFRRLVAFTFGRCGWLIHDDMTNSFKCGLCCRIQPPAWNSWAHSAACPVIGGDK
jgi:hypothetical protein